MAPIPHRHNPCCVHVCFPNIDRDNHLRPFFSTFLFTPVETSRRISFAPSVGQATPKSGRQGSKPSTATPSPCPEASQSARSRRQMHHAVRAVAAGIERLAVRLVAERPRHPERRVVVVPGRRDRGLRLERPEGEREHRRRASAGRIHDRARHRRATRTSPPCGAGQSRRPRAPARRSARRHAGP